MFLSRVIINQNRAAARNWLSNPQKIHASVMQSFSRIALQENETNGRPLWRLEKNDSEYYLYVVSPIKPDFTHIVEQVGRPHDVHGITVKDYTPVFRNLENGNIYRFKTILNPVTATGHKRKPHVTSLQRKEWFKTKTETWGFSVTADGFDNTENGFLYFTKQGDRKVSIATATYEGIITVTDADLMKKTLAHGIGKGKAYGLGMLTLALK